MSIIAWDGKILAADRQGVNHDLAVEAKKITNIDNAIAAWTGDLAAGPILIDWYTSGAKQEDWPDFQKSEDWSRLIIATKNMVTVYERIPYPIEIKEKFMAWGSGRDYAIGAMAAGASAADAVLIANKYCITCGLGFDALEVPK